MAEISVVSRALGIEIDPLEPGILDPSEAEKYAAAIGRQGRLADMLTERVIDVGPITSSMRTDVQNRRPVEVDVRSQPSCTKCWNVNDLLSLSCCRQ